MSTGRLQNALSGITCPIVTPFTAVDTIDEDALENLVDKLVANGIDALFPCGTTGEFASLSPAERIRVIEIVADHAPDEVPIVAGAGATSVAETREYIDEAAGVGADAAVIVPPYFHTANDPAGNQAFFQACADNSPLPLLLYNIPACTGQAITPETATVAADHDRIIGLKDSSGDFDAFLTVLRRTPEDFLCLQGYDALLVPSLRMGADGGVNALSNVIPEVFVDALERAGDERGRVLQQRAIAPLFEACTAYGFAPATKAALVHREWLPSDAMRPPLVSVPEDGTKTIAEAVDGALACLDEAN